MKNIMLVVFMAFVLLACKEQRASSASGVKPASATVTTGTDGLTIEQKNVSDRLKMDNKLGSIKHLYVISAYSGQTLIYSTVRGKVTSSGKRLTPTSVHIERGTTADGFRFSFSGNNQWTTEVLQDDGTYGSSIEYLYWWDAQGRYHQHYVSGGQVLHVSDQPIAVKSVVINMEMSK